MRHALDIEIPPTLLHPVRVHRRAFSLSSAREKKENEMREGGESRREEEEGAGWRGAGARGGRRERGRRERADLRGALVDRLIVSAAEGVAFRLRVQR
eukprot:2235740-Rhodomonas_salina.2